MIAFAVMHHPTLERSVLWETQIRPALERERVKFELFTDTKGEGAWTNARRAWMALATSREPYAAVLQDDMLPCAGFESKAERFAERHDGHALSIFQPACQPENVGLVKQAMLMRADFAIPDTWIAWGGGLILPTKMIREVVQFANLLDGFKQQDDLRLSRALFRLGKPIIQIGVSLLRHVGANQSTIGNVITDLEYATGYSFEGA